MVMPRWWRCARLPRLGEIHELPQIVERHNVDHVFVALPLAIRAEAHRRSLGSCGGRLIERAIAALEPWLAQAGFKLGAGATVLELLERDRRDDGVDRWWHLGRPRRIGRSIR